MITILLEVIGVCFSGLFVEKKFVADLPNFEPTFELAANVLSVWVCAVFSILLIFFKRSWWSYLPFLCSLFVPIVISGMGRTGLEFGWFYVWLLPCIILPLCIYGAGLIFCRPELKDKHFVLYLLTLFFGIPIFNGLVYGAVSLLFILLGWKW